VQHLFKSWASFVADLRDAPHVLLLSDYDGTLTPIVSRPEEAILPPAVRDKLHTLSERPGFSVGIISGRSLPEVKSMVGIEKIYYAGNHGLEMEGPGIKFISPEAQAARARMKDLARQLVSRLTSIKGALVEDKGLSLSIHYRLVKRGEENTVTEIINHLASPLLNNGEIRITSGKKVWEIRPPIDWHKGKAVEAIRKEIKIFQKLEQVMTIYLGDDITDEDAFRVIHHPEGWSIFVGRENPASDGEYFLKSTSEVAYFLSRLLELS
jgi:trehalose-phosphatase